MASNEHADPFSPPNNPNIKIEQEGDNAWSAKAYDYVQHGRATIIPSAVGRDRPQDDSGLQLNKENPHKARVQIIYTDPESPRCAWDPNSDIMYALDNKGNPDFNRPIDKEGNPISLEEEKEEVADANEPKEEANTLGSSDKDSQVPDKAMEQGIMSLGGLSRGISSKKPINNRPEPRSSDVEVKENKFSEDKQTVSEPNVRVNFGFPGLGKVTFRFHEVVIDSNNELVALVVDMDAPNVDPPQLEPTPEGSTLALHLTDSSSNQFTLYCEYFGWSYTTKSNIHHILLRLVDAE